MVRSWYAHPTSGPDALQLNQLASAWHDGAAAPLTYRAAALQLAELPREARMEDSRRFFQRSPTRMDSTSKKTL